MYLYFVITVSWNIKTLYDCIFTVPGHVVSSGTLTVNRRELCASQNSLCGFD